MNDLDDELIYGRLQKIDLLSLGNKGRIINLEKRIEKLESDFDKIGVEERLHNLEGHAGNLMHRIGHNSIYTGNLDSKLNNLEKTVADACEQIEDLQNIEIEDRFNELQCLMSSSMARNFEVALLHTKVVNLEEAINRIVEDNINEREKPHKCPSCDGFGNRIYENEVSYCSSCEGKGIVWG